MNTPPAHDPCARPHLAGLTAAQEFNAAWGVTMPAELAPASGPAPYREAIRGLVTREVHEPEVFKLFFG